MAFGLGELRLSPGEFWKMTPREIVAAAGATGALSEAPPSQARLADLMAQYPDTGVGDGRGL